MLVLSHTVMKTSVLSLQDSSDKWEHWEKPL